MPKTGKSKKSSMMVRVCPKCKFANVSEDKSGFLQKMEIAPSMYVCNKCGHTGYIFPEVDSSKLKSFEKQVDKRHLRFKDDDKIEPINVAYGRSNHWKMISQVFFVLGVISAIFVFLDSGSNGEYWAAPMTLFAFCLISRYFSTSK